MFVGILKVAIFLPESSSLKDKRMAIKSLKDRIRNRFNVTIAEIDHHDKWQKSVVAIANISSSKRLINSILSNVVNFIQGFKCVEMIDYELQII